MENRNDFGSILPLLPVILRSSVVCWPSSLVVALRDLSRGPVVSNVNSGQIFAVAIADIRNSLGFHDFHPSVGLGFSLFFDDLISKDDSDKWFRDVIPRLADLLLGLPELLEIHYRLADNSNEMETGLRLLHPHQPGIVLLSQVEGGLFYSYWTNTEELIAALLVCAFFCLFPITYRGANLLGPINFDNLFRCLYESFCVNQEHKIKCLIHYFERICLDIPTGNISYERKVLPLTKRQSDIVYPEADFWSESATSLARFEVSTSGLIEDQPTEALEVDFANKYIGGGALGRGCVQEEIRFMINPELIVSMLFLPAMENNEAIEIVGVERFSTYVGYASSFRFRGDYADHKSMDVMGRRLTRIIAIDALCYPGKRQYTHKCLLRETNKAFCGFFDQLKTRPFQTLFHVKDQSDHASGNGFRDQQIKSMITEEASTPSQEEKPTSGQVGKSNRKMVHQHPNSDGDIGIATGNWGCGAFGGDPQVKFVVQWLAASQARRPFILYHTFHLEALEKLEHVVQWILSHEWTVGDLWSILVEYSTQRLEGETSGDLFKWLLPSLHEDDPMVLDEPQNCTDNVDCNAAFRSMIEK